MLEVFKMALVNCPECQHSVSDQAKNCPNCGYPFPPNEPVAEIPAPDSPLSKRQPDKKWLIGILCGIAVILITVITTVKLQGSRTTFTATDTNLGCTPQEVIDVINDVVDYNNTASSDTVFLSIPDYDVYSPPESVDVAGINLYFKFETDDAGKATQIDLYWTATDDFTASAGLYMLAMFNCYSPGNEEEMRTEVQQAMVKGTYWADTLNNVICYFSGTESSFYYFSVMLPEAK